MTADNKKETENENTQSVDRFGAYSIVGLTAAFALGAVVDPAAFLPPLAMLTTSSAVLDYWDLFKEIGTAFNTVAQDIKHVLGIGNTPQGPSNRASAPAP